MITPEKHFAPGVDLRSMTTQASYAWDCAAVVWARRDRKATATSLYRPGLFTLVGFHGDGNGIDIGMRGVPLDEGDLMHAELDAWIGRRGGGQFDVVNELRPGSSPGWSGPHIHIEFDPKEGNTMTRRIVAVLAVLALPLLAFAQDVPTTDFDPMVLLSALVKAVMAGQWPVALVMLFVGLVWALRKFGVKAWPWLATSEGGTALAFVTVLASVLGAAALAPGAAITWALVGKAAMLAVTAIGGWTGVRRLLRLLLPVTAKVPWLYAIVVFLSGAEVPAKVEAAAAQKYVPLPPGMTPQEAAKLLGAPPAGP